MTTGPDARRLGLDRALQEIDERLAPWLARDQPVDIDDLCRLPVYDRP